MSKERNKVKNRTLNSREKDLVNLFGKMSHYNAAEGNWFKEKNARESCKKKLQSFVCQMLEDGYTINHIENLASGWLLYKSDYMEVTHVNSRTTDRIGVEN